MFNLVSDFCFVLFLLCFLLFAFSLAVILKYVNLLSLLFSLTLSLFLSLILILSISCQQTPSIFKTCFSQSLSFTYSSFFFFLSCTLFSSAVSDNLPQPYVHLDWSI